MLLGTHCWEEARRGRFGMQAVQALVRVTEMSSGHFSGPVGLEATVFETRVGPSEGDW